MWYYYSLYKKEIIVVSCIIWLVAFFILMYKYLPVWSHIDNVTINTQSWKLVFDDTQMQSMQEYDYYQTYIYPNTFSLTCESKDQSICLKIEKNQELLKNYVVWFFWKDLNAGKPGKVEIDTFLNDAQNTKNTVREIFATLYVWNQSSKQDTWYEKYFEHKKTSADNKVTLNSLEIMCITNIKNSIPTWSFDEDNLIKKRVLNECKWYENMSQIQIAFWWSNPTKEEVKLDIKITEVRVLYKFFKKEEKEFQEKRAEELFIASNMGISDAVNLDYFRR